MSEGTKVFDSPRTLVEGQRLDQPTFHALYEAMSPGTRAELIDGVVYMPSPVGLAHGVAQVPVIVWLAPSARELVRENRRNSQDRVDAFPVDGALG